MTISPETKLVVFGNLNYPFGSAPTSRIHAYAKGIVEKGFGVTVICIGFPFRGKVNFKYNFPMEVEQYKVKQYNMDLLRKIRGLLD